MELFFIVSAFGTFAIAFAHENMLYCQTEQDVTLINSPTVKTYKNQNDPHRCCQYCFMNSKCVAWTWDKADKTCRLRSSLGKRKRKAGARVSIVRCNHRKNCVKQTQAKTCDRQVNYTGSVGVTLSGKKCQRWDAQTPHSHGYGGVAAANGLCQNPDGALQPWCFTEDPKVIWEYCFEPCWDWPWLRITEADFGSQDLLEIWDGGVGNTDLSDIIVVHTRTKSYSGLGYRNTFSWSQKLTGRTTDDKGFFVMARSAKVYPERDMAFPAKGKTNPLWIGASGPGGGAVSLYFKTFFDTKITVNGSRKFFQTNLIDSFNSNGGHGSPPRHSFLWQYTWRKDLGGSYQRATNFFMPNCNPCFQRCIKPSPKWEDGYNACFRRELSEQTKIGMVRGKKLKPANNLDRVKTFTKKNARWTVCAVECAKSKFCKSFNQFKQGDREFKCELFNKPNLPKIAAADDVIFGSLT